jgi:ribosomal-protein-serine acetyltransferase
MFRIPVDKSLDLALLEVRHASMLFALVEENREHLRRYLPWVDATRTVNDSITYINATLEQFARSQSVNVGIFTQGMLAGICGYHVIDWANRRTALGYWLAASFQGRGLMTRSVRALTAHAFSSLGLHRLEIRAALPKTAVGKLSKKELKDEEAARAAAARTFCTAASNSPIRMPTIAITTSNSIRVNAARRSILLITFPSTCAARGGLYQ